MRPALHPPSSFSIIVVSAPMFLGRSQTMWAHSHLIWSQEASFFSINLVPKQRMFLGQAIYVLGPLQLAFALSTPLGLKIKLSI